MSPDKPVAAAVPASMVIALPDDYQESEDLDVRYETFLTSAAMRTAVRIAIGGAETWQEARAATEQALIEHPEAPAFDKEQYVAILMLENQLLPGDPTSDPARLDAIGAYLDVLVEHRNPSAELIGRGLETIEGHWSEQRLSATARGGYDAAERYVEIKADCEGCGLEDIRRTSSRLSGTDGVAVTIQRALDGAEDLRARF